MILSTSSQAVAKVPAMELAHHDDAVTGAALIAEVTAGPLLIVEPIPIAAAAERAGPVLVGEEARFNAEAG